MISEPKPRFSFLHGDVTALLPRGSRQASYRITVSPMGSPTPTWDSGVVESSENSLVEYAGPALEPFTRYQWTARWSALGVPPVTSAPATSTFETGPMARLTMHPLRSGGLHVFPSTFQPCMLQRSQSRHAPALPTSTRVFARLK